MADTLPTVPDRVGQPSAAAVSASSASFSIRRLALQWAPPLLWMAAILLASNDWLSSQETEGWLRRILVAIFGPISAAKLQALHFFARKAGHVLSYAVLAWLAYRSARASLQDRTTTWLPRAALYALGFALATASLDEIHQSFTQTRTGTVEDVALDMAGSLAAITCIWMVSQWRRRRAVA